MGYGKINQIGCGIHLRQFSRAFIFDDNQNRAVFVTVDALSTGFSVKKTVLIFFFKFSLLKQILRF